MRAFRGQVKPRAPRCSTIKTPTGDPPAIHAAAITVQTGHDICGCLFLQDMESRHVRHPFVLSQGGHYVRVRLRATPFSGSTCLKRPIRQSEPQETTPGDAIHAGPPRPFQDWPDYLNLPHVLNCPFTLAAGQTAFCHRDIHLHSRKSAAHPGAVSGTPSCGSRCHLMIPFLL